MAWTTVAGVLMLVMAGTVDADADLYILESSINDTSAKLQSLGNDLGNLLTIAAIAQSNVDTLLQMTTTLVTMNDQEDQRLDGLKDRLDDLQEEVQPVVGNVARAHVVAKLNNERFLRCWEDFDNQDALNNLQDARLDGLNLLPDQIGDGIEEAVEDLSDQAEEKLDSLEQVNDDLETLFDQRQCMTFYTTVAISDEAGQDGILGTTTLDLDSFTAMQVLPNVYCGITGINSTINAPKHTPHSYGYKPSDREVSSFSLSCFFTDTFDLSIVLEDLSQSNQHANSVSSVSVMAKVCSFQSVLSQ